MMGTRCGSLDPGVLLYLMEEHAAGRRGLEDLIYRQSGLLGVSGISSDMRDPARIGRPRGRAKRSPCSSIASCARSARWRPRWAASTACVHRRHRRARRETRREVDDGCAWLGCVLDDDANAAGKTRIDAATSRLPVWVLPTDEERVIARQTAALVGANVPAQPTLTPA